MNDNKLDPQPKRSVGEILAWVVIWLVGGVLCLIGLVYLSCGGACT